MRFATEAADPENAGLGYARAFLEPVKNKFPGISYSDLWILAAYVGLETTGGPVIPFRAGRTDHPDESYWSCPQSGGMSYGRLPAAEKYCCPHLDGADVSGSIDASSGTVKGWEGLSTHVRHEVFGRMGFNDQEIVALLCGGHVYGRCHPEFSGYAGPWVESMTSFSNEYVRRWRHHPPNHARRRHHHHHHHHHHRPPPPPLINEYVRRCAPPRRATTLTTDTTTTP